MTYVPVLSPVPSCWPKTALESLEVPASLSGAQRTPEVSHTGLKRSAGPVGVGAQGPSCASPRVPTLTVL